MFKLKPKKKIEPPPVYKFVPLKPNPALAMGAMAPAVPAHKVCSYTFVYLLFNANKIKSFKNNF